MKLPANATLHIMQALQTQAYWRENENLTAVLRDWDATLREQKTSKIIHSEWKLIDMDVDLDNLSDENDDAVTIRFSVTYTVRDMAGEYDDELINVSITRTGFRNHGHGGWQ